MDKRAHKERFDSGLKTRREVLGAPWVDKVIQVLGALSLAPLIVPAELLRMLR